MMLKQHNFVCPRNTFRKKTKNTAIASRNMHKLFTTMQIFQLKWNSKTWSRCLLQHCSVSRLFLTAKIIPKTTPTAMTWWVGFCGLDLYGWNMSTIHSTLTPRGDWEINVYKAQLAELSKKQLWSTATWETNVKNSCGNPPQNLFWSNSHLPQKPPETLRQMYKTVWGTLHRTFWEANAICCKKPQKTNVSFCPKTFTMAEDPKGNTVREKCKKKWRNW